MTNGGLFDGIQGTVKLERLPAEYIFRKKKKTVCDATTQMFYCLMYYVHKYDIRYVQVQKIVMKI